MAPLPGRAEKLMEFERFTAADPQGLESAIVAQRVALQSAVAATDGSALVEHAADLASMLTTARREEEALHVLLQHLPLAHTHSAVEAAGWFWNAYATALQYLSRREEAQTAFDHALQLARAHGWTRLESFILVHLGRCLVETGRLSDAQACFERAHAIRVGLADPRQATSARLIDALAALEDKGTQRGSPL